MRRLAYAKQMLYRQIRAYYGLTATFFLPIARKIEILIKYTF